MPDDDLPPAPTDSPHEEASPGRRGKIIARMLATAQELQAHGLDVHAIPIGSDLVDCRGAVTELSVTNPTAPHQGHVRIKRHPTNLAVTATWELATPIRENGTSIKHLASTITHILSDPSLR
jgi:hypothetical protein